VGSHASIAERVRAMVGPDDPVSWLTTEPDVRLTRAYPWMLRVVDAAAAIAGRGFPAAADVAVRLRLADELCPANAGLWSLAVSGGQGTLLRRGAGDAAEPAAPLVLGMRGFAALYAGTPLATLRAAGLAAGGGPASDAALDGAFAATSYLLDYF
jgi:predicted acetyltransferase